MKVIFDLEAAHRVLPRVKEITSQAIAESEALLREAQAASDPAAERPKVERRLKLIVETWAERVSELGCVANGVWLVDFDYGEGYYCWRHPEATIEYCHSYEEGFAGRRLITPTIVH